MKYPLIITSLIIAILPLSISNAQTTLEECQTLAGKNYPAIRQYSLIEKTRDYTLKNASMAWIPKISLNAQFTVQNKVPQFPEEFNPMLAAANVKMDGIKKEQYKAGIDISQTIWDGGKYMADKELAEADAKEQKSSVDVDIYSIRSRIEEIYFGVLLLNNKISQTGSKITLLESSLSKARSLVKNGVALQSDADAIEAEVLTAKQGLAQLGSARESYVRMLEIFTSAKINPDSLQTPPMPEISAGGNNRPELAYLDARINRLKAQEKLVKVASSPQLGLFAQGFYGYPGFDYLQGMQNNDMSFNAIAGVRMVWNISSLFTRKVNLGSLSAARSRLEVQKDIFTFNTRLQSEGQNNEISRLRSVLSEDDRIVELRKNVRMAAESKFRNGVIDVNDLLLKITAENEAVMNKHEHNIQLIKTAYEYRNTTNIR